MPVTVTDDLIRVQTVYLLCKVGFCKFMQLKFSAFAWKLWNLFDARRRSLGNCLIKRHETVFQIKISLHLAHIERLFTEWWQSKIEKISWKVILTIRQSGSEVKSALKKVKRNSICHREWVCRLTNRYRECRSRIRKRPSRTRSCCQTSTSERAGLMPSRLSSRSKRWAEQLRIFSKCVKLKECSLWSKSGWFECLWNVCWLEKINSGKIRLWAAIKRVLEWFMTTQWHCGMFHVKNKLRRGQINRFS